MTATTTPRIRPSLEVLEDRFLLATATFANGVLTVTGTNSADQLVVQQSTDRIVVSDGHQVIPINGYYAWVSPSLVGRVVVNAGGGDDLVRLDGNGTPYTLRVPAAVYGGAGNDRIVGGLGNDYLDGGAGADTLIGLAGYDTYFEAYNPSSPALNGTRPGDIRQSQSGTCVILAALSSAAESGVDLAERIRYLGNGQYTVLLYHPVTLEPTLVPVYFDGTWHSAPNDGTLTSEFYNDPMPTTDGEFWTILYQRAYLSLIDSISPGSHEYANLRNAVAAVTGRAATAFLNPGTFGDGELEALVQALSQGRVVAAGTSANAPRVDSVLSPAHAYAVVRVFDAGGTWYVTLRNPHGFDSASQPSRDGADDGYVTVTLETFRVAFLAFYFA
jgi:Ca2+-binding RTX toxin-like protein